MTEQVSAKFLSSLKPETREWLKTNVDYRPSEELYRIPEHYDQFIGAAVYDNAWLAFAIADILKRKGNPVGFVVETAAGIGAAIRRINEVNPDARLGCIEWSAELCEKGRKELPHVEFFQEDMTQWTPADGAKVDLMFNTASSLGFFDVDNLIKHIETVANSLADGGAYFMDVGYYSHISCPSLDTHFNGKWTEKKRKLLRSHVVSGYNMLTDMHNISFSQWDITDKSPVLQFAYTHQLRAYRFSELRVIAERFGLKARYWEWKWISEDVGYEFRQVNEATATVKNWLDEDGFTVEFYKGDAPSIANTEDQ